jgi:hypothetical protein
MSPKSRRNITATRLNMEHTDLEARRQTGESENGNGEE